jgi:hypothetical protein
MLAFLLLLMARLIQRTLEPLLPVRTQREDGVVRGRTATADRGRCLAIPLTRVLFRCLRLLADRSRESMFRQMTGDRGDSQYDFNAGRIVVELFILFVLEIEYKSVWRDQSGYPRPSRDGGGRRGLRRGGMGWDRFRPAAKPETNRLTSPNAHSPSLITSPEPRGVRRPRTASSGGRGDD